MEFENFNLSDVLPSGLSCWDRTSIGKPRTAASRASDLHTSYNESHAQIELIAII